MPPNKASLMIEDVGDEEQQAQKPNTWAEKHPTDFHKDDLITIQLSDGMTIMIIKMLTEIMTIFASTILLWIVLDNKSLTNATCDLSRSTSFQNPIIDFPDPNLYIDCQNMPKLSEFVDYWSAYSNVTLVSGTELRSYLKTLQDNACQNNERSATVYFLAGYIGCITLVVFWIKYMLESVTDSFENFKENGVFSEIWLPNALLWVFCFAGVGGGAVFVGCIRILLPIPGVVSGYSNLIFNTCKFGENSAFAAYCFTIFSGCFGVISSFLFVRTMFLTLSTYRGIQNFMKTSGLDKEYKQMKEVKKKITHFNDPFFARFGEKMYYDADEYKLYIQKKDLSIDVTPKFI